MMELGESTAIGEAMEVDSVKPGVERMPLEMVEADVDADAKRNMPSRTAKVEDEEAKSVVVEDPPLKAVVVEERSLKAVESEVDMMDEQSQPVESAGLDCGAKKKPSLASRLLKKTKSTTGKKGKDTPDKEIRKKGSTMDVALRSALKSALDLLHFRGRQERQPGATR
jgi:hypothetical protein